MKCLSKVSHHLGLATGDMYSPTAVTVSSLVFKRRSLPAFPLLDHVPGCESVARLLHRRFLYQYLLSGRWSSPKLREHEYSSRSCMMLEAIPT
jgi:hypothetical protein